MTTPQDRRHRTLASEPDNDAVAAAPLPGGYLSLVARRKDGAITGAELLDMDGNALAPAEVVRILGIARRNAQTVLDQTTDHLVAHLAIRQAQGEDVNITGTARDVGLARQTLYNRLEDVTVAKPKRGKR